ncbi:hypothetical protein BCR33DRAFT_786964 [Rhizoclosmatium globosum]|uniref:Uncharacterized protein n=1 Tax=Rhizoclosmatium globosum TaxID=329046 RepID=A0A1Y2C2E6_9FUNG|nr:hypothetical protein BCR33DRAFT_786964 [Rhizoclosmatium globosum]|eukprot:ORY41208.1 hypothetical protein BCR33DRAFT_786964 [Rhizoclosmatium globosum]
MSRPTTPSTTPYVQAIVMRERALTEVNPTLGSQHSDLHHRYFIVHLSTGHSKTTEYGLFEDEEVGKVVVKDGAKTIHAMVEAVEFEVDDGKGYEWDKFHHWIVHKSGYHNTPWSPDHHSVTFIEDCLDHLKKHTIRPNTAAGDAEEKLDNIQDATSEAEAIFDAVKAEVVHKFHDLHKDDLVHHTHIFDKAAHITAYKLKQFGSRELAYGTVYIGKLDIGQGNFLHVRVHKYHPGSPKEVEFHSIRFTRDSGIWSDKAELVWFEV